MSDLSRCMTKKKVFCHDRNEADLISPIKTSRKVSALPVLPNYNSELFVFLQHRSGSQPGL